MPLNSILASLNFSSKIEKRNDFFIRFALVLICLIGYGYALLWYYLDQPFASKICLVNGIIASFGFFYKKVGMSTKLIANLLLFLALLFCVFTNILFFKQLPIFSAYYCLIPMASLLLLTRYYTLVWIVACLIMSILSSILSEQYHTPFDMDSHLHLVLNIVQGLTVFFVVNSMVYLYDLKNMEFIETLTYQNSIIKKSQTDLQKSQKFKDNFFASISHEIRTPMNAIKGISELLLQSQNQSNDETELYTALNNSSNHLLSIINDLLDLGKMDEKKLKILNIDFDLRENINISLKMVKYAATEKKIQLEVKIDPELPNFIIGDPLRINQILVNLLNNSVKFTHSGSVSLEVTKKVIDHQEFLYCQIIDTGIGIDDDQKDSIFDRFSQKTSYSSIKYGGTGLGLNIAKNLVELMNGKIWFESEKGIGTTFFILLPLLKSNQNHPSEKVVDYTKLFDDMNDFKILIVDDNNLNLLVAQRLISNAIKKVKILTAVNGRDAVHILTEQPDIKLVLMDIQMPILNGKDATLQIKSNPAINSIPIVAMTATGDSMEIQDCLDQGMVDYISKPFDSNNLLLLIRKYIKPMKEISSPI